MLITASITPFKGNLIDWNSLDELINIQSKAGVDALLVCGSTGEGTLVSDEERELLFRYARKKFSNHLMCGCSDFSVERVRSHIKVAFAEGADSVLITPPPYIRLNQNEILAFFYRLLDESPLPIVPYNNPGRGLSFISIESANKLILHERVLGYKDSSGSVDYALAVQGKLLSGDDCHAFSLRHHAIGHVSVLSNYMPDQMKELLLGNAEIDRWVQAFSSIQGSNPVVIKYLLQLAGIASEECRFPYLTLGQEQKKEVQQLMRVMQWVPKR